MITSLHTLLTSVLVLGSCTAGSADPRPTRPQSEDTAQIAEYVVAALEDSRGNLWFGTNGQGVARYEPANEFRPVGALRYFSVEHGLVGDVVTDIAEDRAGRLWFGTQTGASRYDPSKTSDASGVSFTNFGVAEGLPGAGCKLLVDRNRTVWAGTSAGAFRFDGVRFQVFELPTPALETLSYKIVAGKVWDLREDSRGNIWFARDGYGACKYDPSAALVPDGKSFTHFTTQDGLCSNNVASIVEDAQGKIWFGSITSDHPQYVAEGGVSRYDTSIAREGSGRALVQFPTVKGLTANDVYNLYVDRSGSVWIGAVRVGAYRYDPSVARDPSAEPFTLFDKTDRPDLTQVFGVQAMEQDRHGTLWFGFSGGLFRFDGKSFVNVTRGGPWASP